jgi:AraC-like DNA-binding protein
MRVREALQRTRDNASATDIAMAWGFYHLGRFAVEYARRFGESPSEMRQLHDTRP